MKKYMIAILMLALVLSVVACDNEQGNESVIGNTHGEVTGKVDLDLRSLDTYNTLVAFMTNPSDYQGKTVAVTATNSVLYNFSQNTVEHIMLGYDPTGCCNAYYPIKATDGVYPANDAVAQFEGRFTYDGYIELFGYSSEKYAPSVDIDTLSMSSEELEILISAYCSNYSSNHSFGKSIRIIGHLQEASGYYYFMGLDSLGNGTWMIEAYEPTKTVQIPLGAQGYLNTVELIGTLSVYFEGENAYPCIIVTEANRVEGAFS